MFYFLTPVILIPAELTPCRMLIPINTGVSASATTEFSNGPASQAVNPMDSTSLTPNALAAFDEPHTNTSQSSNSPAINFS